MIRKKGPQPRRPSSIRTERERAYEDVRGLIAALSAELPNPEAAQSLLQLASEAVDSLCRYLEHPEEAAGSLPGEPPWHPIIVSSLADVAIRIAVATLTYARHHPEQLGEILPGATEWPVLISLDPTRDIRKVVRNPVSTAARFYAPILESMGHDALFPGPKTREHGIFHRIAEEVAESIRWWPGPAVAFRLGGLPWYLDYVDPHGVYTLRSNHVQPGDDREWAIALKYLLHLTLSPEPFRSRLRAEWRASRVEAFKNFHPPNPDDAGLHQALLDTTPQPSPLEAGGTDLEEFSLPALAIFRANDKHIASRPMWAWWWEYTLKYETDALFGHSKPLNESSEPAVVKLTSDKVVRGNPRAAFGRCINSILDAFLHLRGVTGGLKTIENKLGKPLPSIRANKVSFDDERRK